MTDISRFVTEIIDAKKQYDKDPVSSSLFYLELGVGDWSRANNSYSLETDHGWAGVSVDNEDKFVNEFNINRKNKCIKADATKINFQDFFKENNVPDRVDYLQIDLHGNHKLGEKAKNDIHKPLKTLVSLPLNHNRFSVITFDFGNLNHFDNWAIRDAQRQVLSSFGYYLLVDKFYEDWWIDGDYFQYEVFNRFHKWTQ
jgi:hypothetical protein